MRVQSLHEDLRNFLFKFGAPLVGTGDVHMVLKAGTASEEYWSQRVPAGHKHATVASANSNIQSLQNDVVIIPGDAHSLAASLTISKNETHWIGTAAPGRMAHRSRIGMSTTFTPMILVSGYGNSFHNIYLQHGTAVGDYVGVEITGSRNSFFNCHFAGPMNAAQASDANFAEVTIAAAETYFKGCTFGNFTQSCDEATSLLVQKAGCGQTILEDCYFFVRASDGDPCFITLTNTTDTGDVILRNCTFVGQITSLTVAFKATGSGLGRIIMDPLTTITGATAISDATDDSYIMLPRTFSTTTDTESNVTVALAV